MTYKLISLLLAGFMLSGCAQRQWQKNGHISTKSQFDNDKYECHSEAARLYPAQSLNDNSAYQINMIAIREASALCMTARGWELVRVKK